MGRFGGFALVIVAFGVLTVTYKVLAKTSRPFLISYAESKEIISVKREKEAAESENRRLQSEKRYLLTNKGKESEAHKLGWVKDGEIAIVVEQPDNSPAPEAETEKVAPKSRWRTMGENTMGKLLFHKPKKLHTEPDSKSVD